MSDAVSGQRGGAEVRALLAVLEPFEIPASGVFVIYGAGPLLPTRVREVINHLAPELAEALR